MADIPESIGMRFDKGWTKEMIPWVEHHVLQCMISENHHLALPTNCDDRITCTSYLPPWGRSRSISNVLRPHHACICVARDHLCENCSLMVTCAKRVLTRTTARNTCVDYNPGIRSNYRNILIGDEDFL